MSPHPKLILISFDGFRYDLLNSTMTPKIFEWASRSSWFVRGLKPQYLSVTAPNHMSIVTGLYEEEHGIHVFISQWESAAGFWQNKAREETPGYDYYNFSKKEGVIESALDAAWYKAEPIWLANERTDPTRRSACFYWPNCEANFPTAPHRPWFSRPWIDYRNISGWMRDVDEIIEMLTNRSYPMNFVAWYISEPDHTLHENGFYNEELQRTMRDLDESFGHLLRRLRDVGLEESVNIILASDHGHYEAALAVASDVQIVRHHHRCREGGNAETLTIKGPDNIMCVREFITDGFADGDQMIYPFNDEIAKELYRNLTSAVKNFGYKVNIYWKEEIPPRFFYSKSSRIGSIIIEPHLGSRISFSPNCTLEKREYKEGMLVFNSSTHGMDPAHWEMHSILVVNGPSIVKGRRIYEVPNNIDLYPLMCHLLSVEPASNSGSMHVLSKALRSYGAGTEAQKNHARVRHVSGSPCTVADCSARLRLAMHGCRCVRQVYGSPCRVADVFGTSTARHSRLPTCWARLRLAMHGCRRVRHVYDSPCTVADVFGRSMASPGTSMFNNRFQCAVPPLQL
ncbi:unnamed protein product [Heligmosomoides polygyrus]|uniref:Bis(5'-adenosyl)-triphosphatase n=1 Tax=Heligmosomoides polygyrus TaxID=6339 RepID=A0A3P7ZVG1_HELPZ|nr:unnamed protein product [Heligmosomoides polygyrus]